MIRHLELKAYGKINLGLDVVRRREDGYHEVRMIMQTVRVYDAIELNRTEEEGIRLSTNLYYLPDNENNLGYRAAKLLMDEFGIRDGVEIKMKKFYPGGSRDGRRQQRCGRSPVWCQQDVRTGAFETGADGARRPSGGGCAVLYHAGNGSFGGNRGDPDTASADAAVPRADCQTGGQRFNEACVRELKPAVSGCRGASGY